MMGPSDLVLNVKQSLSCAWAPDQMLGKNRHSDVIINVGQNLKHDGPLGSPTLNPTFSNGRTVYDIKHMVMFSVVPT